MIRLYILSICYCISLNVNGQSVNEDSLHLSKHLETFRKHLDSVTTGLNVKYLVSLYTKNFSQGKTGDIKASEKQNNLEDYNIGAGLTPTKILPPYKYSYNEIISNDTNHILFIETEYQLPNRNELEKYKIEYQQSKTLKDQIYSCINFYSQLSRFYPSLGNWKFSRSRTLNKYINYTASLIEWLPKDTMKIFILGDFGHSLEQIDRIELQQYILGVYLKAEQMLIRPYQKYLKDNQLVDDSAYFRKYLNQGSIGSALINLNYDISSLLEPEERFDFKNELYPFLKKRLFYLQRALQTFEIQKGKNHMSYDYTKAEEKYLMALTSFKVFDKSKYYSSIIYDRIMLLKNYVSKLFFPRTDSLTPRREYNLYYSLAYIFHGQKEYDYALKAFYKASEIRLNFTSEPMGIADIPVFIDIFESIQKDNQNRSYEQEQAMTDVIDLYLSIINSEPCLGEQDSLIFSVFKLLGQSSLLIYRGDVDKAESLLVAKKKELFKDTTLTNSNRAVIGFLYRGLLNTNWAPNKNSETPEIEREADSTIYSLVKKGGFLDFESSYNGDEYLAEKFSNLESIENNSTWYAKAEELNEQINQKVSEINALNVVRNTLSKTVENLGGTIKSLEREIGLLNKSLLNKKRETEILNDSVLQKNRALGAISAQNYELEKNIITAGIRLDSLNSVAGFLHSKNKTLNNVNKTLIWSVSLLVFSLMPISFILRKKVARIKALDNEIAHKEKEAREKDLGKKLAEQKLLNDTALGHDLIELIDHIPYSIKAMGKVLPSDLRESPEFEKCQQFADKVRDYFRENFDLKEQQVNTVRKDIDLAIQYCSLLQMMNSDDGTAAIDVSKVDPDLLDIEIPKHNMVNFISNSYRHGRVKTENVNISLEGYKTQQGFTIKITDNGGGFKTLNLESKKDTRGIRLVLRQIENFNTLVENKYRIGFTKDDIKNVFVNGIQQGACVIYKMERK